MLITQSRARSSPVFRRYICQSNAQSLETGVRKSNYKSQRRLYLLVKDTVLLIDICDIPSILVRTLPGELAPLVDTKKKGINEEQGMHSIPRRTLD